MQSHMEPGLKEQKAALRGQVRIKLEGISEPARAAASAQACARLKSQPAWHEAASVLLYAPLAGELDVWPLLTEAITAGKTVALPRFEPGGGIYEAGRVRDPSELRGGRFGVREPAPGGEVVPLKRLDFILVPGIAFDLHGRRLGRGKGFYDQLLAAVCGTTCGVAFDEQIADFVPVEPHDIHLNCILTPTRWVRLLPARGL